MKAIVPFRDRFSLAVEALTGKAFEPQPPANELEAAFNEKMRERKMATEFRYSWDLIEPQWSNAKFETMVKEGYRRNELIFACISKTANTAAQVELQIHEGDNDVPIDNHPLRALIRRPNKYMNEFDFWAAIIIYQKLAGRAYFEKQRDNSDRVIALWPLRPDWVTPILKSQTEVDYYEYGPPGMPARPKIEVRNILDFKLWDPMGLFESWPPVQVAARSGDIDNSATNFLKLFFDKGGTPPGILKTVQKLKDAQVETLRMRWRQRYGGYENWLDPAILDADAEYQRIGLTFKEMGFETLDSRNEARICMVLDIPPIIVGAKIGLDRATYSNYGEARQSWWQDSLVPMYVNFVDTIENQLAPDFGANVKPRWNWANVPALQEERNGRWARATAAFNAGAITVNEFRAEIGKPSIGPAGDVYIRNPAFVAVSLDGQIMTMPGNEPEPTTTEPQLEPSNEPEEGAALFPAMHIHDNGNGHGHKVSTVAGNAPDEEIRRKYEKALASRLEKYFKEQLKRIEQETEDAR